MGTLENKMNTLENNMKNALENKMCTLENNINLKMEELLLNQKSQAEEQKLLVGGLIEAIKQMKIDEISDSQIDSSR